MSFVIPTHGDPRYLFEAIETVRQQSHPVDQIVVAVDGTRDQTSARLRERYPDVTVLPAIGQLGEAATRNRAIRAATGDIVFFLDGDDLAHPERVATTLRYMQEHPDCRAVRAPIWLFSEVDDGPREAWGMRRDFVASGIEECLAHARRAGPVNDFTYLDIQGRSLELMLEFNRGVISTSAVERELLLSAGLPPDDLRCGVDWTMFVNVARVTEWHLISTALGFQRLHAASDTQSGGIALARGIIDAKRRTWELERTYRLGDYGVEYAAEMHGFVSGLIRAGRWRDAVSLAWAGRRLLPRWRDRLRVLRPARMRGPWAKPRRKARLTDGTSV